MNSLKRNIKRVFWMIALIFFLTIAFLLRLVFVQGDEISKSAYNPRLNYIDNSIKRGNIKDLDGDILAESILQSDGTYVRKYPRARMTAHVTGYSDVGKTGVEAAENFTLQTPHLEFFQRILQVVKKTEVQGNDVVLSIDMDIQSVAGDLLGNNKGAVVAIEPSTGRILALQAYPDFDPNTVKQNWESLTQDEDSSLLNRSTQGLYPPGSTFKVVTALAAMDKMADWSTFTHECDGEVEFDNKVIHCYNGKSHGTVDMKKALAVSCNSYFAALGKKIGAINLREKADVLYCNRDYDFQLAHKKSQVALDKSSTESELVETAIGQGKTLVTPLYMAMLVSAIANDGIMMKPYLVDHIEYFNGKAGKVTVPEKITKICTPEQANLLTDMMIEVVSNGTGGAASVSGVSVAGKTGTAENATGSDHSWFIGFAPAENPKVAVAVMLENSDAGARATPIAGKVIKAVMDKYGY